MAFLGMFKSKEERALDDALKKIGQAIFPGGEADIQRDIARVAKITHSKIPADKIRGFVSGCKTLVHISESYDDEGFVRSFKIRSENAITDTEAWEIYAYFEGEASYLDNTTRMLKVHPNATPADISGALAGVNDIYANGTYKDSIEGGHGEFGLTLTNPIPTMSVRGSNRYLAKLRYLGSPLKNTRVGSTTSSVTSGNIDIYELSVEGKKVGAIYICPYHKRNSRSAPKGFSLG